MSHPWRGHYCGVLTRHRQESEENGISWYHCGNCDFTSSSRSNLCYCGWLTGLWEGSMLSSQLQMHSCSSPQVFFQVDAIVCVLFLGSLLWSNFILLIVLWTWTCVIIAPLPDDAQTISKVEDSPSLYLFRDSRPHHGFSIGFWASYVFLPSF